MRKKLLDAPPEAGAIETYTSDLSRRLRSNLPGDRTDEIVREAEAHLHDQADAIANASETSVPRQEAEAQAVAEFTPPNTFARDMARSAIETRFSKAWFGVSKAVALLAIGVLAAGFVVDGLVVLPYTFGYDAEAFAQNVYMALFLVLCLCAFLARRAQTIRLLFATTIAGAFVFVYTGFFYVIQPQRGTEQEMSQSRLSARDNYEGWRDARLHAKRDEEQLLAGLKIYRVTNPIVPAELKTANGTAYTVPNPVMPNMGLAHTKRRDACYYYPLDPSYKASAKTLAEARVHWLTDGPTYLKQARYEQNHDLRYEEPLRIAMQQTGFSQSAGWEGAENILFPGLFLMLFDWLFAKMGRVIYTKRRARRKRKASHA